MLILALKPQRERAPAAVQCKGLLMITCPRMSSIQKVWTIKGPSAGVKWKSTLEQYWLVCQYNNNAILAHILSTYILTLEHEPSENNRTAVKFLNGVCLRHQVNLDDHCMALQWHGSSLAISSGGNVFALQSSFRKKKKIYLTTLPVLLSWETRGVSAS